MSRFTYIDTIRTDGTLTLGTFIAHLEGLRDRFGPDLFVEIEDDADLCITVEADEGTPVAVIIR